MDIKAVAIQALQDLLDISEGARLPTKDHARGRRSIEIVQQVVEEYDIQLKDLQEQLKEVIDGKKDAKTKTE